MATRNAEVLKVQPVLGDYDASRYVSARLWATAPDGAQVPISVVHRRDTPVDGSAPALLYGYGSYEISSDPSFRSSRLSLLDRGFVYAIAHVRGGGEMGREWYEAGRLEHKANTFTDFIACAQHLIASGYTSPGRLVARGASAGGLLVGAVANLRPDLFAAIVAEVPFVDVVTTMLDPTLPLTVTEWEEWGDPREADAYARMKAYSPYDNVQRADYPALFVTTGLNDPRVQYWEPAKWVAKLRGCNTSTKPILLRTEMGAGHGGPSGRYDAWRDEATVLAFVCNAVGVTA
jgi:oligopeptidase B